VRLDDGRRDPENPDTGSDGARCRRASPGERSQRNAGGRAGDRLHARWSFGGDEAAGRTLAPGGSEVGLPLRSGMPRRLLLLLLFAVPAAGAGVSGVLVWGVESGLKKAFPELDAGARAEFTMARACADPRVAAAAPDACSMSSYDDLLRLVSIPAGLLGVFWLAVISGAGRLARRSRTLLLRLFVPGLHATHLVAVALVVAAAIVAIAPVPLLLMAFPGGWAIKIGLVLAVVVVGALGGVLAMVKAWVSVVRRPATPVLGKVVAEEDAPALWEVVRGVCGAVGAEPPDNLVLGLEPAFFVSEAAVRCVDRPLAGRTMFVSLPLCRILSLDEVRAALGHELAHFAGLDTRFAREFLPVYRGTAVALRGLAATRSGGAASLAVLPAVSLLSFFFDSFAAVERDVSRERELVADLAGARVTSAEVMAAALVKVHAFSDAWAAAESVMAEALRGGTACENASLLFAELVASNASPERLAGLEDRALAHPTDSHPPLASRLRNLGTSLSQVAGAALRVRPEAPAIDALDGAERVEGELTRIVQALLARQRGIALAGGGDRARPLATPPRSG
jgi:Zn-dependent protease with chaperone function